MDFLKTKVGIAVAILCLAVVAAVILFTLKGQNRQVMPEGTLVEACSREVTA